MIAEILSVENFIRDFVELTELNSFVFNLGLDFLCIVTLSVFSKFLAMTASSSQCRKNPIMGNILRIYNYWVKMIGIFIKLI